MEAHMRTSYLRALAAAGLAVLAIALAASPASADPNKAKNSITFPASCSDGTTVRDLQVVVNNANGKGQGTQNNPKGQALFAPAQVLGTNEVFHPTIFDLTFTFTSSDGSTQSFHDTASRKNPRAPENCSIDFSQTDEQGNSFSFNGTVGGYFT
jgi:hypothetical protein